VLIARGHAYAAGGEVLFDVSSMPDYGTLSGRKLEEQQAGARVAVEAHKKNPGDFVLWKLSSAEEPGWDSPWGRGRPGWHIECSVMSKDALGEVFDIHGGGLDLIFPHHENEIAQSRCAHGTKVMANYWMHNGFLQVEGQKMSKSLGNFYTIQQLLGTRDFGSNKWHGYTLRLAMLMTHYRQPIDWSVNRLVEARSLLNDWISTAIGSTDSAEAPEELVEALSDDLNTPDMIPLLHTWHRWGRGKKDLQSAQNLARSLRFLGIWNGEASHEVYSYGYEVTSGPAEWDVNPLIAARLEARKAKNWAESDRIRDQLWSMGIQIRDVKDPATGEMKTEWEVKR
jgi:cysteinyl-tRNA synthetase